MRRLLTLALLLALAAPAHAARMQKAVKLVPMSGGLNLQAGPLNTPPSDLLAAENVDYEKDGSIRKRKGYTKVDTNVITDSTTLITGLADFSRSNGTQYFLAWTDDGKFWKEVSTVWTELASGYSTGEGYEVSSAVWKDNIVFCHAKSSQFARKFDGTTVSALATGSGAGTPPTDCAVPRVFQNRMMIVQVDSSVLYYSAADTLEDFTDTDAGYENINDNDGDIIMTVEPFLNDLIIFKRNSIYYLTGYGPSNWAVGKLFDGAGAACRRCVTQVSTKGGQDLIFVHHSGVYSLRGVQEYGNYNLARISTPIQPLWDELNKNRLAYTDIAYHPSTGQLWITVSKDNASQNEMVLKYFLKNGTWTTMTGKGFHSLGLLRNSDNALDLYAGGYDGYVYKQFDGESDAGSGIAAVFQTAWLFGDSVYTEKSFKELSIFYKAKGAYPVVVAWQIDECGVGSVAPTLTAPGDVLGVDFTLGTSVLAMPGVKKYRYSKALGKGSRIKVEISNTTADQPFEIYGMVLRYTEADL